MPHLTSPRALATGLVALLCTITPSGAQSFAITGAGNRNNVQQRLEISTLQSNADQWNLYLLALSGWQMEDQEPIDSYYQVSALHGVPFQPWDNVPGIDGAQTGYCTHSSPLFPAWHRAYMALYEQILTRKVQRMAARFPAGPKRRKYTRAAQTFRVPYWDWAAGQGLPESITNDRVTLDTPEGSKVLLNPLMQYNFHPLDTDGFVMAPWNAWRHTQRYPTSVESNAVSTMKNATDSISSASEDLRNKVSNILTFCKTYSGFANADSAGTTPDCPSALETIHNDIHLDMGGPNGTMTVLWYSSFDPVFWLHHANVDRIFALWQGLNPTSYSFNTPLAQGTYSVPAGHVVNPSSPLIPFSKDTSGSFYSSNDVKDTHIFGYTYPEFADGQTTVGNLRDKVKQLYGAFSSQAPLATTKKRSMSSYNTPFSHKDKPYHAHEATHHAVDDIPESDLHGYTPGKQPTPDSTKDTSSKSSSSTSSHSTPTHSKPHHIIPDTISHKKPVHKPHHDKPHHISPGMTTSNHPHYSNGTTVIEYTTTIACEAYALGGSYQIIVFLGEPASEDPSTWSTDKNKCGVHSSFSSPGMHSMTVNTGSVSLNRALNTHVSNGILPNLNSEHVLPYLTDRLTWRAKKQDGTAISPEKVPGLAVGVCSQKIKPAKKPTDFAQQDGGYTVHKDVTHAKPAGIKTQQQLQQNFPLPCNKCNPASVAGSNKNTYTPPFNPPATPPTDYSVDEGSDIPSGGSGSPSSSSVPNSSDSTTPTQPDSVPGAAQTPCDTPSPVPFPVAANKPAKPAGFQGSPAPIYPQGNGTVPARVAPTGSVVPSPSPKSSEVPLYRNAGSRDQVAFTGLLAVAMAAAFWTL